MDEEERLHDDRAALRQVERREGLTATDFKYTFDDAEDPRAPAAHAVDDGPRRTCSAVGNSKVVFTFKGTPNYQECDNYLYNVPIVPEHIWHSYDSNTIVSGNLTTRRS